MVGKLIQQSWMQLGAIGLLIVFLVVGLVCLTRHIKCLMKVHHAERAEWRVEASGQTKKMLSVVEQNSTAVSKLCTLIEARER